jgi:hypothetical protein
LIDKIKRLDVELNQSLEKASIAIKSAEKTRLNHDIKTLIIMSTPSRSASWMIS